MLKVNQLLRNDKGEFAFIVTAHMAEEELIYQLAFFGIETRMYVNEEEIKAHGYVPVDTHVRPAKIDVRSAPAKKPLFPKFTMVQHVKNGDLYHISQVPINRFLELTGEPAYEYTDRFGVKWNRSQAEMEDGRFIVANV